jgi:mitochondrial fission protein ELM1
VTAHKLHGECWAITDESAGNQRQALALAAHLGLPFRHLILQPRAPWHWLAPRLIWGARYGLPRGQRRAFSPPWPTVAIGCGRQAALFTRWLGQHTDGDCYTVQILDPRVAPTHFDTVIAPQHDLLDGPSVLRPLGSLNPIDDAWLADGRDACATLADLPRPRVGVLIGGPRKGVPIDTHYAEQLATHLRAQQQREGGSVMALASGRTPMPVIEVLRAALKNIPGLIWAGPNNGRNPYPGVLGWADRLVVTPDSVNMLSEACAVGCPVQTLVLSPLPAKLARFHRSLREAGLLHDLLGDAPGRHLPLRETGAIGDVLRERMVDAKR